MVIESDQTIKVTDQYFEEKANRLADFIKSSVAKFDNSDYFDYENSRFKIPLSDLPYRLPEDTEERIRICKEIADIFDFERVEEEDYLEQVAIGNGEYYEEDYEYEPEDGEVYYEEVGNDVVFLEDDEYGLPKEASFEVDAEVNKAATVFIEGQFLIYDP